MVVLLEHFLIVFLMDAVGVEDFAIVICLLYFRGDVPFYNRTYCCSIVCGCG